MVVLAVPYISQLMGNPPTGGANCGPASLASLLAYRGVIAPTQGAMLYVADIVRDGLPDGHGMTGGYTTFQQLIDCAGWFDQQMVWVGSWAGVHASLAAGEPVILLVDNTALWPRQYPRSPAFDAHHFVVLTGYTPPVAGASADAASDTFMVNDPLSVYAAGPAPYTAASLVAATTLVGGIQGIALVPFAQEQPQMDGIVAELNKQVTDLRAEIDGLHGITTELQRQVNALHEEVATRTQERDALQGMVATYEPRIATMEEALRIAVAAASRRPQRVEVQFTDGHPIVFVPEAA